ncbi:MAG: alginate lyase family protein [Blastocatellia bacterium]|nr:alginate lyase family protein [Blastocatellia bacterium]
MKQQTALDIFQPPLSAYAPEQILEYYHSRTSVSYFPVINEAETTRAKIDGVLENWFDFNGEAHRLKEGFDWSVNPSTDIEWQIMLHKFYYAVGLGRACQETGDPRYARKWMALTASWIRTVPHDLLSSDVAGRRIQNWIFAHHYFVTASPTPQLSPEFYLEFLTSLHQQVRWLRENLTPARNHRTLELYAIFLAAVVFPEMRGAREWLAFSRAELLRNLQTDLLADGVQCELSTDYHHIVLRNYLGVRRLAALNGIEMPAEMDDLIRKALAFATYIHKPDGTIPALSDGDTGSYLDLLQQGADLYGCEEMRYVATAGREGAAPQSRSKAFPESGYYVLRSGWGEAEEAFRDARYLVFDCGPLGAGNHGHLDLLSFEAAAYGRSLIVDPGRYTYDESGAVNWRVRFRGTGYHNTVQIDGENQTRYEFYKRKFKIRGPEPDRELKRYYNDDHFDYLHGIARSHQYPVVHERRIFFCGLEYWIVIDQLFAEEAHRYDLRFHLSAEAHGQTALDDSKETIRVEAPHLVIAQPKIAEMDVRLEEGFVSPSYGVKHPAPVLRASQRAANASFHTVLFPYRSERPGIAIAPVRIDDGGTTLEIGIERGGARVTDSLHLSSRGVAPTAGLGADEFEYSRKDARGEILRRHSCRRNEENRQ